MQTDLAERGAGGTISGVTSASFNFAASAVAALHGVTEAQGSRRAEAARAVARSLLLSLGKGISAELLRVASVCCHMWLGTTSDCPACVLRLP